MDMLHTYGNDWMFPLIRHSNHKTAIRTDNTVTPSQFSAILPMHCSPENLNIH